MKYTLRIAFAGVYLVVPDDELKVVHVLFPRHGPHGNHGHGGSHTGHVDMPPHDVILAADEERKLPAISLNGFDLNLSGLSLDSTMPMLPPNLYTLTDVSAPTRTGVVCPLDVARSGNPVELFNARVTLRGGMFEVYSASSFKLEDGSKVSLAGIIIWKGELVGHGFPGATLTSMYRGVHQSIPPLAPLSDDLDSHDVRLGIVHCPEPIRVDTLEDILQPNATFNADHIEMLYGLVPGVTKPEIPAPDRGGQGTVHVRWPDRCLGARSA